MAPNCVFCSIIDGEIPGRIVYKGEHSVAFLDANPLAVGHTLVVPREHTERLNDVPEETASDLYGAIHALVPAIEAAVEADGTTVAFNNGTAAGQEVPHVHCHIVPRFDNDTAGPIHAAFGSDRPDPADEELDDIATAIHHRM